MSDRYRLLILSTLILAGVSFTGVAVTAFDQSPWIAGVKTLAVIIGGGTLLVRVTNPFVRRLELNVAQLQEMTRHLEAKAAELARINRELDDFTYVASHDLKEPLRGISSYCQILVEDYSDRLDDEGRRRLTSLVALCQRLGQLIDDLLAYSRIGRAKPAAEEVDLGAVVNDVLQTLGPAIEQRNAHVAVNDILPIVTADRTLVAEVFRNLIGNGLKFNETPSPRIEIGCCGGLPMTIYVRDNGIGIPPHHHNEVFTMFRRLHSRRKYDGTGAGLSLVRKIVAAHGGRVWVESMPGEGATFYFTLAPEATETAADSTATHDRIAIDSAAGAVSAMQVAGAIPPLPPLRRRDQAESTTSPLNDNRHDESTSFANLVG